MKREDFLVRNSERSKFGGCRWSWMQAYKLRWSPFKRSIPLEAGDLIHQALARYYIPESIHKRRRGPHPAKTFLKIYDHLERGGTDFNVKFIEADEEKWMKFRDLGQEMLENYIDHYGKDANILIIYPEISFHYKVMHLGRLVGTHVGSSDALIWDIERRRLGLFEHKTAAQISMEHLFIDDQAGTYWDLVPRWLRENGIIGPDDDMKFMLYNFLRKGTTDKRPQNPQGQYLNLPSKDAVETKMKELGLLMPKPKTVVNMSDTLRAAGVDVAQLGEPSSRQSTPLFERREVLRGVHDRNQAHQRLIQQMDEIFAAHNGDLPLYKRPSKDCRWCEFKDVCEVHEIGADYKDLRSMTFSKWDPYAQHDMGLEPVPVMVRQSLAEVLPKRRTR